MSGNGNSAAIMDGPISGPQRRALFAIAKARGLEIDDLRAMTPLDSISKLSRAEAAELLQRLNAGSDYDHPRPAKPREKRRPKGVYRIVTDRQLRFIEAQRVDLGWPREKRVEFLGGRRHADGRTLTSIMSTADANTVIELLKAVYSRPCYRERRERSATG